jgi:hydrocephalus-inducing protein
MTKKEKEAETEEIIDVPHQGSLFFPLPNGTALLYNLNGVATAPESEGAITETISAKKQRNFIIQVKNWSKQTQRFSADWEIEG